MSKSKVNRFLFTFPSFGMSHATTYRFPVLLENASKITQLIGSQKVLKMGERDGWRDASESTTLTQFHSFNVTEATIRFTMYICFICSSSDTCTRTQTHTDAHTHTHTYARLTHTKTRSLIVRLLALGWQSKRIQSNRNKKKRRRRRRENKLVYRMHIAFTTV